MGFDIGLVKAMRSAEKVLVFTGAGISKESGLPTFRDLDGIWTKYDPMTFATLEGFISEPVLVWNNYRMRQIQISETLPNPGHYTIAAMEDYYPEFLLVTQNVDDLHERSGSTKMVKIHGDAFGVRCVDCSTKYRSNSLNLPDTFTAETLPRCSACNGICRPDIVWFGEYVNEDDINKAYDYANTCDMVIVVGTSGEVSRGYGLVQTTARRRKTVVEINPNETALTDYATYIVREASGTSLPRLWTQVTESQPNA